MQSADCILSPMQSADCAGSQIACNMSTRSSELRTLNHFKHQVKDCELSPHKHSDVSSDFLSQDITATASHNTIKKNHKVDLHTVLDWIGICLFGVLLGSHHAVPVP